VRLSCNEIGDQKAVSSKNRFHTHHSFWLNHWLLKTRSGLLKHRDIVTHKTDFPLTLYQGWFFGQYNGRFKYLGFLAA